MESFSDALRTFIEEWEGDETNTEIVAELRDAADQIEKNDAANS